MVTCVTALKAGLMRSLSSQHKEGLVGRRAGAFEFTVSDRADWGKELSLSAVAIL